MKTTKLKTIIFFILLTIIATIGLQVFWNIKNYYENKNRLFNEVQIAFDNGIERYYVEDAKNDFVTFIGDSKIKSDAFIEEVKKDSLYNAAKNNANNKTKKRKEIKTVMTKITWKFKSKDSTQLRPTYDSITAKLFDSLNPDRIKSIRIVTKNSNQTENKQNEKKSITVFKGTKNTDSIFKIKEVANRIVISMIRDSINMKKLSRNINNELKRKNITIDYAIYHIKSNKLFDQLKTKPQASLPLETESKSIYIPNNQQLKLAYSNPVLLILKRSLVEISLSLLLSLSVIGCLLYLLKTIHQQKKIDEIKNDLISNITHEFKTPITTITAAIEGIKHFNTTNDTEKNQRYLFISSQHLKKLESMVERLLETATIETNQLILKKETVNIVELVTNCLQKYSINTDKNVSLKSDFESLLATIDPFHIENAISNLIDNALKYGGQEITIGIEKTAKKIIVFVEDNGAEIEKSQQKMIFEKFYRIPKGNLHDIKGFGIGLYYSKTIIEKHNGTLELICRENCNIFKINLLNGI